MKAEQQSRSDRAITLIAESVTKAIDQAEALARKAELQRLVFLANIVKLQGNARRLQVTLEDTVRRRESGENSTSPTSLS